MDNNTTPSLSKEVKWRGSTYTLEKVENGKVYWFNPVSRYHGTCDTDSWAAGRPYGDTYA